MKLSSLPTNNSSTIASMSWLLLGALAIGLSAGALNNNVALTASVWDGLQTWLAGMLTSTWVLVLALIALISAVWTLAHGGGYRGIALILGILGVALIGPGVVTQVAQANGQVASISVPSGTFSKSIKGL
jgi:hypothetical protein